MHDYPYVCGADIHSISNKEFVRFETTKSRDIVVALDKSNIPFSAKYDDTEIVLTYDGNYKDSVDEITAKVMSVKYDELLREIREIQRVFRFSTKVFQKEKYRCYRQLRTSRSVHKGAYQGLCR